MSEHLKISNLVRQTGIYGLFQLLGRAINFIVVPIYSFYLIPAAFGVLDILYLMVWFIGILGGGKIEAAFLRYFKEAAEDGDSSKGTDALYRTALHGVIFLATVFVAVGALTAPYTLPLLFPSTTAPYTGFYLALLATWVQLTAVIPLALHRAQHRAKLVGSLALTQACISATIGILLVAKFNLGVVGILIGLAAGTGALAIGALSAGPSIFGRINHDYLGKMIAYSLPMLPAPLLMYLLHYADRYLLMYFSDMNNVGLYGMAYRLAMLLNLLVMAPFGEMWGPNQFSLHQANAKDTFERLALFYVGGLAFVGAGIIAFAFEFVTFALSSEYRGVLPLVAPLVCGMVIWGIVPTMEIGYLSQNKTWMRTATTGIAALCNVLLNILLIPTWGALGAAYATAISFVVLTGVALILNWRLTDFRPDLRKVVYFVGLVILFSIVVTISLSQLDYLPSLCVRLVSLALLAWALLRSLQLDPAKMISMIQSRQPADG